MNISQSHGRKHKNKKTFKLASSLFYQLRLNNPSARVKEFSVHDEEESETSDIRLL